MSYLPVETIEIAMNLEDGSYRLQECRDVEGGRMVLRTVTGVFSITEGLRKLADETRDAALKEFLQPRGESDVSS